MIIKITLKTLKVILTVIGIIVVALGVTTLVAIVQHPSKVKAVVMTADPEAVEWAKISPEITERALKTARLAQQEKDEPTQLKSILDKYFLEPAKLQTSFEKLKRMPKEGKGVITSVTAYNSEYNQTDATPCLAEPTRNNICELDGKLQAENGLYICASNKFDLGTELEIRTKANTVFGKCIVLDRMNARYKNNIDIYLNKDVERARNFGRQNLWVKVTGEYENFKGLIN